MFSNQYPTIIYGIVGGQVVPLGTIFVNANGLLILVPSSGGGGSTGHFDSSGNPRIYDANTMGGGWWTLTAPNGVPSCTNFSANP